jgi:Protein of unknown function (DUF4038)
LTNGAIAQSPWDRGRLQVSDNGRYLQHADGTPFFWLGDTVWLLFQKMDRDEVRTYFENRKRKGFDVVQCIAVQTLKDVNAYGDAAIVDGDIAQFRTTPGSDPGNPDQYE